MRALTGFAGSDVLAAREEAKAIYALVAGLTSWNLPTGRT
jgi:hypothetical protein